MTTRRSRVRFYIENGAHSYGNHHSNVRLLVKSADAGWLGEPHRAGKRRGSSARRAWNAWSFGVIGAAFRKRSLPVKLHAAEEWADPGLRRI